MDNEKKCAEILEIIYQFLNSVELLNLGRFCKNDFTRNRVLCFQRLVSFIINLARKSLKLELNSFTKNLNIEDITTQAFSKARKKLNPIVFKLLNNKLIEEFYSDNEFKLFEGYRLLAIDGSKLQLPSSDEIIKEYGCTKNNYGDNLPSAQASTIFDALNKLTIDAIISKYKTSEKDLALQHIENILEVNKLTKFRHKDLFILDRGYPSMQLLTKFLVKKMDFLIRCPSIFISEVRSVIKKGSIDQIIETDIFKKGNVSMHEHFPDLDKNMKIKLRVLVFNLPSGEKEILLTSLLDKKAFSPLTLFNLYSRRWDTEENYKFHKSIAQIENFSGKSKKSIEQDFHATVFTCNLANMLAAETLEEIQETLKEKNLKYDYTINKNIALGTLKDELIYTLLFHKDIDEFCEKVKNQMAQSLVPIRTGRSFPRHKSFHRNYATNRRSCL